LDISSWYFCSAVFPEVFPEFFPEGFKEAVGVFG
jgi:hypothetical protein